MRRTGRTIAAAAAVYAVTWLTNRALRRVDGPSMEPTLQAGEVVLTVPARPTVGAIVAWPVAGRWRIKRVAAVGPATVTLPEGSWQLRDGEVFLLGDAPHASTDSRSFGPLPAAELRRRAVAVVWPRPRRL